MDYEPMDKVVDPFSEEFSYEDYWMYKTVFGPKDGTAGPEMGAQGDEPNPADYGSMEAYERACRERQALRESGEDELPAPKEPMMAEERKEETAPEPPAWLERLSGFDRDLAEEYDLRPEVFAVEEAFLEALEGVRFQWRENYIGEELRLNPEDFDTEEEFLAAMDEEKVDDWEKGYVRRELFPSIPVWREPAKEPESPLEETAPELVRKWRVKVRPRRAAAKEKKVYTYCGVQLVPSGEIYSFRTEDDSLRVGDMVRFRLPGVEETHTAPLVYVGQYTAPAAPCPPELARFILGRA